MTDPLTTAAASSLATVLKALLAELPATIERLEQHPSAAAVKEARGLVLRLADLVGLQPTPRKSKGFTLADILTQKSLKTQVSQLHRLVDDLDLYEQ